jgi:serine/threonine protein kinase/formylglycine-generating enzyme required for sulfatase activity/dienelactone hydrolase
MGCEPTDIKSIFVEALEMAVEERPAFLDRVCGNNDSLRGKVEEFLRLNEDVGDFLESPPLIDQPPLSNPPEEKLGTTIDKYRLLEKIGEGGMAVVYMAEQTEPIRRKVALKIIKLGMDTKSVIARFEAERQALAMMDHPNIAKVLDAGATETGRPYFVMELVTGVSITEYCDKNNLSTKERLALFIQVCNAVQHAHQKGIIHRDIKPTNVMVTRHEGQPVPKVIDFGIAKAINQKLTEKTLFTRYAHIIGTPAYMSPEQADLGDLDVDTRSDIYSLGVLLYELLTGTTPFGEEELRKAGYLEMQRLICEQEPPKPSTKLSTLGETLTDIAKYRGSTPDLLTKAIRGDLDWIVMKSLEKDRTRRYETAHTLAEDIERHLKNEPILAGSPSLVYRAQKFWRRQQSRIAIAGVVTVLLLCLLTMTEMYLGSRKNERIQWAKGQAVPEIVELIDQQRYSEALALAKGAERYIPDDPGLVALWPHICRDYSIATKPSGAEVFCREYAAMDAPWQYLGRSPLEQITLPQGPLRWKIEKDGFVTHERVVEHSFEVRLQPEDPTGEMVWVGPWEKVELPSAAQTQGTTVDIPEHLIHKYEVTNEQFQAFVDAGGYANVDYWEGLDFVKDGRQLSWQEAMVEFTDQTGQPGPSTWENRAYPQGRERHPVSGVSWFEAMAYARFAGKSLPTVYDWQRAACLKESFVIIPFSNFTLDDTAPVGSHRGMGRTGLYDMAGNVREWCFNATDDSGALRYCLGGSWGEPKYMFGAKNAYSPWHRSAQDGFRCVRFPQESESATSKFRAPVPLPGWRDISDLQPFSDDEFDSYNALFQYDQRPLHARVEKVDNTSPFWREETITFDAAYAGHRVIVHLFLPKSGKPPYQTVVFFPGRNAIEDTSFQGPPYRALWQCIVSSGRAVLFPIYYGTYERPSEHGRVWTVQSAAKTPLIYWDWMIRMAKDLRRSIDYLETRDDIDSDKIGYYGYSNGSLLGQIILAVESRIDTGIFVHGGLLPIDLPRSCDLALYAQRIHVPVLMVNGAEDVLAPVQTCQLPMYEMLKRANADAEHKLYPGGHGEFSLFFEQIREDVLSWLDLYLGPVNGTKSDMK